MIVADDASGPEHLAALRAIDGIDVLVRVRAQQRLRRERQPRPARHAARARRGRAQLRRRGSLPGWLEGLQYAAYRDCDVGIVGAQLLYPDGRIQFGGTVRNRDAPEWFDHRYRFKPGDWGPAAQTSPALAVTGACMYVRREVIERVGLLDERYPMAYEDVDWCLRAWQAGYRVRYFPIARLIHHESAHARHRRRASASSTPSACSGSAGRASSTTARSTRAIRAPVGARSGETRGPTSTGGTPREPFGTGEGSRLRIVYVTEDTGIGGGHRDIFEHLNRLADRGHDVALYTLGERPDWFELRAPVHSFADYDALVAALAPLDAIKVATWWMTALPVFRASVARGIPVYFVQDIETSYYPDHEDARHAVLDSYRPEFRYMTISAWNRERLRELGLDAELIPPGIDLDTFRPRAEVARREDMVLALGRSNPLKNLPLTLDAWRALAEPRPELCLFGIEPELATDPGMRYMRSPGDERVDELFCQATVFVQTSTHEGFALPPLEAMATGAAVVCTDAHGNRDFCRDGVNCLMPDPNPRAVSAAIARLLGDPELRARLGRAGIETAADYAWERRIDALEDFYERIACSRSMARGGEVLAGGC